MKSAWPEVRLDAIAEVRLGRQRSPKNHYGTHMRPYVRAANVGWQGLILDDVKSMNFTDAEMDTYRLRQGDLLLNEASGSQHEVGKPAIWNGELDECAFQNTLLRVRPRGADSRYLLHFFAAQAESGRFAAASRGVGIHHLGREALAAWEIPLPPIEEQRRIAAILDQADELRVKRRASLALLDSLTESIFLDMFGDPQTNPHGWPRLPLRELCVIPGEYGAAVASVANDSALPRYVRITDVTSTGELNRDQVSPGGSPDDWARFLLTDGDVLFARSGATVGKTYIHRPAASSRAHVFAGYLIRFRPDPSILDADYLFGFTRTTEYQAWVAARQRVVAQPNINATQYATELRVPVPPLTLQQDLARRVGILRSRQSEARRSESTLDALFASLQQRAFSGQV